MESQRQQKFSRMLQKDLGEIFQQDIKGQFGNAFITVTQVRMSPDLAIAKVYLSLMMVEDKEGFMDGLIQKKSHIRKLLGNRIGKKVRIVPDLHFYIDDSADYADNIENILKNLDIPPEEENENPDLN